MRRIVNILCFSIIFFSLLQAAEETPGKKSFTLTLKGGWGTARIGDINNYYKTYCASVPFEIPENEGNKVPQLSSRLAIFEVEGQYHLNRKLILGVSLGLPAVKSDKAIWFVYSDENLLPVELKPEVLIFCPVKFNFYYRLPLSPKIQFLAGGGSGIYLTKIKSPFNVVSHFPFGLQAVSKLEMNLSRRLSLILEGELRLAKITNFKGSDWNTDKGTLWYYRVREIGSSVWREEWDVVETAPVQDPFGEKEYKDQRKAVFDLSGFSAKIGLRFRIF
ncbi:MAG: hypothetical protein WBI18_02355 [Candidatus Saccharicenans sp.]